MKRTTWAAWLTLLGATSVLLAAAPSHAATREPTISGSVSGTLRKGTTATFTLTATHPQGWGALREVGVILTLKELPLDRIEFDADDQAVSTGGTKALLGTGNVAVGPFFRLSALDVELTSAGDRLTVTMRPNVVEDIPPGARFEFVAEDDFGNSVSVGRVAPVEPEGGGLPLGAVVLGVAVALLAGGFVGSRVTAHHRPTARSIYAGVQRRIQEQPSVRPVRAPEARAEVAPADRVPVPRSGGGTTAAGKPRRKPRATSGTRSGAPSKKRTKTSSTSGAASTSKRSTSSGRTAARRKPTASTKGTRKASSAKGRTSRPRGSS